MSRPEPAPSLSPQARTANLARAARLYATLQRWRRQATDATTRAALDDATRLVLAAIEALDAERDHDARELIADAEAALAVGEAATREEARRG